MFNVLALLLLLTTLAFFSSKEHNFKLFSYGLLMLSALSFGYFSVVYVKQDDFIASINWLKNLDISISFNKDMFVFISSVFIAAIATSILNIKHQLKNSLENNAYIIYLVVSLMFLASSVNVAQLIISLFFINIITTCIISNNQTHNRSFVYYNTIADSFLFFVCASLMIANNNININTLHVATDSYLLKALFSIAISIKLCLWGVNNYIYKLKTMPETTALSFIYLSIPISGLIVFYKMPFMLQSFVGYWALASCLLYLIYFIIDANLVAKLINFSLATILFAFYSEHYYLLNTSLLIVFLISLIISASSLETNILLMGGFIKKAKFLYIASLIIVLLYISSLLTTAQTAITIAFEFLSILGILLLIKNVFIKKFMGFDEVFDNIKNPDAMCFIPIICTIFALTYSFSYTTFFVFACFIMLQTLPIEKLIKQKEIAEFGFLSAIEDLLTKPLRFAGRVLWLVVDFLFIQRTIVSTSSLINQYAIKKYKNLEGKYLVWMLLGFIGLAVVGAVYYE